jgi:hypothetical protein
MQGHLTLVESDRSSADSSPVLPMQPAGLPPTPSTLLRDAGVNPLYRGAGGGSLVSPNTLLGLPSPGVNGTPQGQTVSLASSAPFALPAAANVAGWPTPGWRGGSAEGDEHGTASSGALLGVPSSVSAAPVGGVTSRGQPFESSALSDINIFAAAASAPSLFGSLADRGAPVLTASTSAFSMFGSSAAHTITGSTVTGGFAAGSFATGGGDGRTTGMQEPLRCGAPCSSSESNAHDSRNGSSSDVSDSGCTSALQSPLDTTPSHLSTPSVAAAAIAQHPSSVRKAMPEMESAAPRREVIAVRPLPLPGVDVPTEVPPLRPAPNVRVAELDAQVQARLASIKLDTAPERAFCLHVPAPCFLRPY